MFIYRMKLPEISVLQMSSIYFNFNSCLFPSCFTDEITASFRRFGPLIVDWPHKAESKSYFPPKGKYLITNNIGAF